MFQGNAPRFLQSGHYIIDFGKDADITWSD